MSSIFKLTLSCSFEYGSNPTTPPMTQASDSRHRAIVQKPGQQRLRPLATPRSPDHQQVWSEDIEDIEDATLSQTSTADSVAARERELVADLRSLMLLEVATAIPSIYSTISGKSQDTTDVVSTKPNLMEALGSRNVDKANFTKTTSSTNGLPFQKPRFGINMPDKVDPFTARTGLRGQGSILLSAAQRMQAKYLGDLLKTVDEQSDSDIASTDRTSPRSNTTAKASKKSPAVEHILQGVGPPNVRPSRAGTKTRIDEDLDTGNDCETMAGSAHESLVIRVEVNESQESDRYSAYTASDESSECSPVQTSIKEGKIASNVEPPHEQELDVSDETIEGGTGLHVSMNEACASMNIEQTREQESDVSDNWQIKASSGQTPKKPVITMSAASSEAIDKTTALSSSLYMSTAEVMSPTSTDQAHEQKSHVGDDWEIEDRPVQSPEHKHSSMATTNYEIPDETSEGSAGLSFPTTQIMPSSSVDQADVQDDEQNDDWEKIEDGDLDRTCW